jgi:hypothetical protein
MNATAVLRCATCRAPMASDQASCLRCGAASARAAEAQDEQARSDAERWANEGGSVETGGTPRRVTVRRWR